MPIHDFLCLDCGEASEVLVLGSSREPECRGCGSRNLKKLLSAHSSYSGSGRSSDRLPGSGDTTCCGTSPGMAGCAGPGSCCGK
jgi:putative FmdB family regulatory protein